MRTLRITFFTSITALFALASCNKQSAPPAVSEPPPTEVAAPTPFATEKKTTTVSGEVYFKTDSGDGLDMSRVPVLVVSSSGPGELVSFNESQLTIIKQQNESRIYDLGSSSGYSAFDHFTRDLNKSVKEFEENLRFDHISLKAKTNRNGEFSVDLPKPGTYKLLVSFDTSRAAGVWLYEFTVKDDETYSAILDNDNIFTSRDNLE